MEYKLFDDYITLQALLKETGIIQSGGAIKSFLSEYPVLFNGEPENRVAELVKAMNKDFKKSQTSKKEKRKNAGLPKKQKTTKSPVRFPGI